MEYAASDEHGMRAPEQGRTLGARGRSTAALACLVVAAQLASAAHLVLVRHAVCPLDGELIHGETAAAHPTVTAHARGQRTPAFRVADAAEAHHGHEHCILASQRRDRATLRAAQFDAHAPDLVLTCRSGEDAEQPGRVVLHRLAPKQSPPA